MARREEERGGVVEGRVEEWGGCGEGEEWDGGRGDE